MAGIYSPPVLPVIGIHLRRRGKEEESSDKINRIDRILKA